MLDETFYLDGIDARTVGIRLQKPITFSEPVPIVESENVPGRNGSLIYDYESFENRTGKAICYCLGNNVEMLVRAANKFLFSSTGYRRLETSDDPNHFWLARISSGARIELRKGKLAPFEITFDCKPQRFLKSGELATSFFGSDDGYVFYNQTGFDAKPLINVYGNGAGTLKIGKYTVEIGNSGYSPVILDCDTQNAYSASGNLNKYVNAPEFPVLVPGENQITFSELISSVEIVPRWWEL